jgi:hypothetical protein
MGQIARERRLGDVALMGVFAAAGSLGWLGIPTLLLWLLSRVTDRYLTVYLCALLGSIPAMAAWGWCLHRLGRGRSVLEAWAAVSVVLAIGAFAAWVVFFGVHGNGAAPGAW